MIDLLGLICLVILQGLHVYRDHMKFKAHANEIKDLKRRQDCCDQGKGDGDQNCIPASRVKQT
jgi:hypothetical protein